MARVVEGNKGARLVFEERLYVEAQEGSRRIRLDVVGAIKANRIEFNGVGGGRDQGPRYDVNN